MIYEHTLSAGTVLYHGTDNDDFDEEVDEIDGPAWFSTSYEVARYFAKRDQWGGKGRVLAYRLKEDLTLPEILSNDDMIALQEQYSLELLGVEGMRESVEASGLPGWYIPHNYPEGDDILIVNTSFLEFQESFALDVTPQPRLR